MGGAYLNLIDDTSIALVTTEGYAGLIKKEKLNSEYPKEKSCP